MPLTEADVAQALAAASRVHQRALDDVRWHLDTFFENIRKSGGEPGVLAAEIYTSSKVSQRLKSAESVYRKCKRDGVDSVGEVYTRIEDLVGLRIATPNKEQAETLFDFLEGTKRSWFCPAKAEPKFVRYTIPDKNNYSLETGYQAYHITFIHDTQYLPFPSIAGWPVEVQIMSQLWEFWAGFSRKYFYGQSGTAARLLPYNVVISRILDAAEDLIVATAKDLRAESEDIVSLGGASVASGPEVISLPSQPIDARILAEAEDASAAPAPEAPSGIRGDKGPPSGAGGRVPTATPAGEGGPLLTETLASPAAGDTPVSPVPPGATALSRELRSTKVTVDGLREWLTPRIAELFGTGARAPHSFYLTKTVEDMVLYDVTVERLKEIFLDAQVAARYNEVLKASHVAYLPPYQQILCKILLSQGWDLTKVVARVNQETWAMGIQLRVPHP